jgi:uncharacterized protein (DUF2249 family)
VVGNPADSTLLSNDADVQFLRPYGRVMALPRAGDEQSRPWPAEARDKRSPHGGVGEQHGLDTEHAVLLREVCVREEAIRAGLRTGRWPASEIQALVDYLRYEVIDQAATEERLLFPLAEGGLAGQGMDGLLDDHVNLRDLTDRLAALAPADNRHILPTELRELLDALRQLLDRHMREEEALLSGATLAGVEAVRRPFRCHLWFPLTEGPVLDLDALPKEYANRAALERFSRLRAGERLQVRARTPLDGLWSALTSSLPGEFGWAYLEEGPDQWQVEVTRRSPE